MKIEKTISYEEFADSSLLSKEEQEHIQLTIDFTQNAYAPYSQFKVAARVVMSDGQVIEGTNQENRAYPSGLCAERVALFAAGAQYPNSKISSIYIAAKGNLIEEDSMLSPCGSCRQVMLESQLRQFSPYKIYLIAMNGKIRVFDSIHDLLPFGFGL